MIESNTGLRLVEIRSLPENMVLHHWEFLHARPPKRFYLQYLELQEITLNATEVTVIAEDSYGNIVKKKIKLESLKTDGACMPQSPLLQRAKTNGPVIPKMDNQVTPNSPRQSPVLVRHSSPVAKPKSRLVQQTINSSPPVSRNLFSSKNKTSAVSQGSKVTTLQNGATSTPLKKGAMPTQLQNGATTSLQNGASPQLQTSACAPPLPLQNGAVTKASITTGVKTDDSLNQHSSELSESPTTNGTLSVGPETVISVMEQLATSNGLVSTKQPSQTDKAELFTNPCNGTVVLGKLQSLTNQQNGIQGAEGHSFTVERHTPIVWNQSKETKPEKNQIKLSSLECAEVLR